MSAPHPLLAEAGALPGRHQVAELAEHFTWIPVFRELLVESLTPTVAFDLLCGPDDTGFLLESVPVGDDVGRYSYLGHRPVAVALPEGDPLPTLKELTERSVAPVTGLPPFHCGAVGYLGYEAARHFERLPRAERGGPDLPESTFLLADDLVVFDHATRSVVLVTLHRPEAEPYEAALERLQVLQDGLADAPATPTFSPAGSHRRVEPDARWTSTTTRAEFEHRVLRAREHIAAGDAFQIVLSQRFSKPLHASPSDLYRHLRAVNPSPYLYHLSLGGGRHVIGASPELLVRAEGRTVRTRPLAGTRPRSTDHVGDLALEQDLLKDGKERAEHVMLVDLGRNDLSRVCVPGTVRVERLMDIERFSHVMHLSSTVAGELDETSTAFDALRSAFPAGTLSGAPKIRAMEIIADLEPDQRGVYGGALGCVGPDGLLDFAIGLRTLVVADGQVHVQAGAGVVADSHPTAEYLETLHKANALFTAVANAEAGS